MRLPWVGLLLLLSSLTLAGCLQPLRPLPRVQPFSAPNLTEAPTGVEGPAEVSPSPALVPSPTPAAAATSPTPSLQGTPLAVSAGACTPAQEGSCLATKPQYCYRGKVLDNCGVCGCPTGARCARGSGVEGYRCLPNEIAGEDYTFVNKTAVAPSPDCAFDYARCASTFPCCSTASACTWDVDNYYCLPVASPIPTSYPKPAQAYSFPVMLDQVANATRQTFNFTPSFSVVVPDQWYAVGERTGRFEVDVHVTKGRYNGYAYGQTLYYVTSPITWWTNVVGISEGYSGFARYTTEARMPCFNWTYAIDAKVTEFPIGRERPILGGLYLESLAGVCP